MLSRILSTILLAWALGFAWFVLALPAPLGEQRSDAVVVLTGGKGRIERGLAVLERGWAKRMFVSGVDRNVKPHEFAIGYKVSIRRMACCVELGYRATDTISNAAEVATWVRTDRIHSLRLVTSDWHMRRAALELRSEVPAGTVILEDAVPDSPSLRMLFMEYHKLLARLIARTWGQ